MVSEKFMVNSEAQRMAAARYATEEFARSAKLGQRDTLRLTLLVEETLGMMKAMVDEFYGQLWFAGEGNKCQLHLQATANVNADAKEELLSVSTTGKNAAAKGFMSMLGEVISSAAHSFGKGLDAAYGQNAVQYGFVSPGGMGTPDVYDLTPIWTLQEYRTNLQSGGDETEKALEDLEKSIVANLADDIVVGVKRDRIEMVIATTFKGA